MTNNYFKVHHYIPIMELRLDVRMLFFFFDGRDPGEAHRAYCTALACMSTIQTMTSGRDVHLSVYRRLATHPAVPEIGDPLARMATMAS